MTDLPTLPFFLGIAGLLWNAVNGRIQASDLWVIIPFLAFGFTSQRAVFPAFIVLLPWMFPWRGSSLERVGRESPVLVIVAAVVVLILPLTLVAGPGQLDSELFPGQAAGLLRGAPVFHDDVVGGYLIYERWPEVLVFVDDRAELYGGEFFNSVISTRNGGPQWAELVHRFAIGEVLVRAEDSIVEVLEGSGWTITYRDVSFLVLKR